MNPIRLGIPLVIIAIFIIYVAYMAFTKKDSKSIKRISFLGLFFIAVWAVIYLLIMS